jgi:hypothetical protein
VSRCSSNQSTQRADALRSDPPEAEDSAGHGRVQCVSGMTLASPLMTGVVAKVRVLVARKTGARQVARLRLTVEQPSSVITQRTKTSDASKSIGPEQNAPIKSKSDRTRRHTAVTHKPALAYLIKWKANQKGRRPLVSRLSSALARVGAERGFRFRSARTRKRDYSRWTLRNSSCGRWALRGWKTKTPYRPAYPDRRARWSSSVDVCLF